MSTTGLRQTIGEGTIRNSYVTTITEDRTEYFTTVATKAREFNRLRQLNQDSTAYRLIDQALTSYPTARHGSRTTRVQATFSGSSSGRRSTGSRPSSSRRPSASSATRSSGPWSSSPALPPLGADWRSPPPGSSALDGTCITASRKTIK